MNVRVVVDYSADRRDRVVEHLRRHAALLTPLTPQAREANTVALLICDDTGRITQADLNTAYGDPSARQAARTLLRRAGLG